MKTQSRRSPAAITPYHAHNYSARSHKSAKATTSPATSPRAPYSVGQNYPPMLSPKRDVETRRAPSPNYFGLVVESGNDPRDSSGLAHHNWSPSSSVKSFDAALPRQVGLESNSDFEAFRKAADLNREKSFSLANVHPVPPTPYPALARPPPLRWQAITDDTTGSDASPPKSIHSSRPRPMAKGEASSDSGSVHDSAPFSSNLKRNPESTTWSPSQLTGGTRRFKSPGLIEMPTQTQLVLPDHKVTAARLSPDQKATDSRLSLNLPKLGPPSPQMRDSNRASTLPSKLEQAPASMVSGEELKTLMETVGLSKLLLLDIRSSQSFAQSRIQGALNICIPTTLLKRATFNIAKLQQTFRGNMDSAQFAKWRQMEWIIVYDAHASDKRDAVTAQNMIKKFTNEGYSGNTAILRGGFSMFQNSFSSLVDHRSTACSSMQQCATAQDGGNLAPVIGGVSLPTLQNDHNPFFSNIRQNMDLADGVGQYDIARPRGLESPLLPSWIRDASKEADHGKKVSNRFLDIELAEQSRMRDAYAAFNPGRNSKGKFQLSGVEKGTKNRYKDILPFEHARVRLQVPHDGLCDYVNASHLSASRSNKRYIASQGPLPATFEDFWSVIWEQDVRVIVMLTAESEGGQLKCHSYWKGRDFGLIKLKALSEKKASLDIDRHRSDAGSAPGTAQSHEFARRRANTTTSFQPPLQSSPEAQTSDAPYVTIRKFALSHAAHPFAPIREITHLHFSAWPDFGTPAQPSHLLALVELANVMQRAAMPVETSAIVGSKLPTIDAVPVTWYNEPEQDAQARPMLVHCSAGCGRTGAFCTVDSVIDMLKRQRLANMAAHRSQAQDGDTPMGNTDYSESSMSRRESVSKSSFGPGGNGRDSQSWTLSNLDTSWLQDDGVDLIQKTVQDFREQRLSMVQTLRQYVLCYETILEWLNRMQDASFNGVTGSRRARSGSLQQGRSGAEFVTRQ
ncbi:hypothetical protein E4U24_001415 [Claviceps purpurea]|nr:hypothetical protein E4U25_004404 [Claviceps purpurea]KAG6251024.1 hypothetical protein E4U24_001415 [Claviceps purpurea]KAG6310632.1 hypothetical protein E4U44_005289 [Claviceps purpurea]